ncbi:GNAT family acetyltransferase [Rhodoferax sp. U2-2l]|uniref:GNAT family acetyltransferase n=1 Tax=Rhodoferax sp. U2-2l TaxID=2884000 RepID=UPI001D0A333B|nr:GNAT family acetyltransferase [Rhodoferax sp. U2-2l]MCB8745634.1 GNAT family acetyltransferase [Rhodoferax sp. U2-2l]
MSPLQTALPDLSTIVDYVDPFHRQQVVALWTTVFAYDAAHNRPDLVIDKKLAVQDDLLFVALDGATVVGTVMAGYDGRRGWLYSVAVHPAHRHRGVGAALVRHAEQALVALGSVKINLQIAGGNEAVAPFYESLGYVVEKRVSMGKPVPQNT